jgi:hypothetical protein
VEDTSMSTTSSNKRINLILPTDELAVKSPDRQNLRRRLKEEALANAERDLQMAAQCYPLEDEAWEVAQNRE